MGCEETNLRQSMKPDLVTGPAMKPRLKDATQSRERGSQGEHGSTWIQNPRISDKHKVQDQVKHIQAHHLSAVPS